jgi:hypothetical protein
MRNNGGDCYGMHSHLLRRTVLDERAVVGGDCFSLTSFGTPVGNNAPSPQSQGGFRNDIMGEEITTAGDHSLPLWTRGDSASIIWKEEACKY